MNDPRADLILETELGLWGGSLPRARQWRKWFAHVRPDLPREHGWQRLIYDALARLTDHLILMGENMRRPSNSADTGRWSPETFKPVEVSARENLAWYEKNRPMDGGLPAWGEMIFEALEGAFIGHVRLADEVRSALDRGFVPIRISPDNVRPLTTQDDVSREVA